MRFENVQVFGFEAALRGMRNAHKSHHLASPEKDERLACTLIDRGQSHRKFLRLPQIIFDQTAPRYFLVEQDTYKIGMTSLSESTIHTLLRDGVTEKDFAIHNEIERNVVQQSIHAINAVRDLWLKDHDPKWIQTVKAILPECFMQKRTIEMSYETARRIYEQRHDHPLPEWREFCAFLETLPHSEWITRGIK